MSMPLNLTRRFPEAGPARIRLCTVVLTAALVAVPGLAYGQAGAAAAKTPALPAQSTPAAGRPAANPAQKADTQNPAGNPAPAPSSLLEQPAAPATVTQSSGSLAVKADNSSLADILHQVASKTGMQLDGLSGDERVFGTFGPGDPRDVLNSLLNGTSYNVMMVGDLANGAPRELLLTRKSGAPPTPSPQPGAQPNQGQDDDAASDDEPPPDEVRPGDIVEREQEMERQQRENSQDGSGQPQRPRTPAEMLQEMQQMRNQVPPPDQQQPPPQ
jgi:hypothetical protein